MRALRSLRRRLRLILARMLAAASDRLSRLASFVGGLVDDNAFEGARPALVELETAGDRFHAHLRVLHFDGHSRELDDHVVEQFVVRTGSTAKSLPDMRNGFRLFSAPGPANIGAARAVLKRVGLVEGKDFSIQELQISLHVGALQSGKFDGGYTLEPAASVMVDQKIVVASTVCKNLFFHRNAFVLASRPLPPAPSGAGVVQKVMDEDGIGLRATLSYNPDHLGVQVTIDLLYGVAELRDSHGGLVNTSEI